MTRPHPPSTLVHVPPRNILPQVPTRRPTHRG